MTFKGTQCFSIIKENGLQLTSQGIIIVAFPIDLRNNYSEWSLTPPSMSSSLVFPSFRFVEKPHLVSSHPTKSFSNPKKQTKKKRVQEGKKKTKAFSPLKFINLNIFDREDTPFLLCYISVVKVIFRLLKSKLRVQGGVLESRLTKSSRVLFVFGHFLGWAAM